MDELVMIYPCGANGDAGYSWFFGAEDLVDDFDPHGCHLGDGSPEFDDTPARWAFNY